MTANTQLAAAAREIAATLKRIDADWKPEMADRWNALVDDVDAALTHEQAVEAIAGFMAEFRADMDPHLATQQPAAQWRHWATS